MDRRQFLLSSISIAACGPAIMRALNTEYAASAWINGTYRQWRWPRALSAEEILRLYNDPYAGLLFDDAITPTT